MAVRYPKWTFQHGHACHLGRRSVDPVWVQAVTTNLPGLVRFAKKAGVNQIEGYGVTPGELPLLLCMVKPNSKFVVGVSYLHKGVVRAILRHNLVIWGLTDVQSSATILEHAATPLA